MKQFEYSLEKNQEVKLRHGVTFADVLAAIKTNKVLANIKNPNQRKYPDQKMLVVEIHGYVYGAPYVEDNEKRFFKTVYPSRKLTRTYLPKTKKGT